MNSKDKKLRTISLVIACTVVLNFFTNVYSYAEAENLIDVNFGELLTLQEENGYAPFEGADMLDNFYQAKAELPEEIPVLNSFEVNGGNVFFVASDGDDSADGLEAAPLATLAEALDRVSALSDSERSDGSVIYLREGEYHLADTINITDDNTSDNSTLFIAAYPDENVTLTTNESVPLSLAQKVTKENTKLITYSRINNNAIGKLYYISYENMGLNKIPYESVFYMNDMPMYVSRYPNQGTDTVDYVIKDGSYINSEGFIRTGLPMEWKSQDTHPFTWNDTGNIHIFGRVANEWSLKDGIVWFDYENKTVKSTSSITPNYSPITTNFWGRIPSTYYYANIFEELDTLGEWFVDDDARRFYFYLPESIDRNSTVINYKKHEGYAIDINGADNVVIDNITVSHVDNGINITNSSNVIIQNCRINNTQSAAVNMTDTEKCGILNSDIRDIQKSYAVTVSQSSSKASELVPRRNFVQNSYIGNVPQAIAVSNTSGNIFNHNLIENTSYSAVNLSGAENIFEYNEFSGVANKITDAGGIYVGGDIKNRANTIRYNYFHDSRPDKKNAKAIYNDDCSDMSWNYGNVIKNFDYGLFQHGGDDHVIMDNIVINATTYIRNSESYSTHEYAMKNYFFKSSPHFINDYVNNNLGSSTTWQSRYKGILKEKYEQVLEAKAGYDKDADGMFQKIYNVITRKNTSSDYANSDDVQKACDLVADTGCYYINNTYIVPGTRYSNGYGPSNYGLYNVCEPDNGGKPHVIYTADAEAADAYDISGVVGNMGLTDGNIYEAEVPHIYMEQKKEFEVDEFTGVSWSEISNCSYYKAEFATDSNFENVVINYDTADNEYPIYKYVYDKENGVNVQSKTSDYNFLTDTPYFARVTAVSLANSAQNEKMVSDTVEFILRDVIEYNRSKNNTSVEYGDTSHMVTVSGEIPSYLLNSDDKQVTVILYDTEKKSSDITAIKQIRQINPDDNTFSCSFKVNDIKNQRIRVRVADGDLTDDLFTATSIIVDEIKFNVSEGDITVGDFVSAAAEVNNKFNIVDEFTIIVAAYDSDNKMIQCTKSDTFTPESNVSLSEVQVLMVPENTAYVKAFMWHMTQLKSWSDMIKKDI